MDGIFIVFIVLLIIIIAVLLLYIFQKKEPVEDVPGLYRTINNLKNELGARKNDCSKYVKDFADLKSKNEKLYWGNKDIAYRNKDLTEKVYSLEKELGKLRVELVSKAESLQKLEGEMEELRDSLASEKKSKDSFQRLYLSEIDKYISAKKEKDSLQKQNIELSVKHDNTVSNLKKLDQKNLDLLKENNATKELLKLLNHKIEEFDKIIAAKNPFDYVAHLRAHALEHAKEYEKMNVEALVSLLKYQYKFEYLLSIYPELRVYREDDAYLQYMQEEEQRCNIISWISDTEYRELSEIEREQLAVDRYIENYKNKWTSWEKGRNYEIYVAYMLYNDKSILDDGFDIIQEGLNKKLEDKGRDIIATHRRTGQVLIIQCKNWSEHSMIRENVIFQLYGSYMQWLIENNKNLTDDVVPCLYYTCDLSPEAEECARMLKVKCVKFPMGKFPAIKCNVNKNTNQLIYHLPFDRHYDLVKINAKGKGYKFSIAEAIKEGFRRAYNH